MKPLLLEHQITFEQSCLTQLSELMPLWVFLYLKSLSMMLVCWPSSSITSWRRIKGNSCVLVVCATTLMPVYAKVMLLQSQEGREEASRQDPFYWKTFFYYTSISFVTFLIPTNWCCKEQRKKHAIASFYVPNRSKIDQLLGKQLKSYTMDYIPFSKGTTI